MPRDSQRNQHMRQLLAQLAAKLMIEHGIRDHAMAKRKAARQLGVSALNLLPGNEEIDTELRAYVALFEPDEHEHDIDVMRRQAADVMASLEAFDPVLTGGVAQGTASRHSDIELDVYADSSKEFEHFLLNRNIAFKSEERRAGSFFTLFSEPVDVMVRVLPLQNKQSGPREPMETRRRLTLEQLRRLLSSDLQGDRIPSVAAVDAVDREGA